MFTLKRFDGEDGSPPILRCLSCSASIFDQKDQILECENCGCSYPILGSAVSFLTDQISKDYKIVDTTNVSDHPYAPTCIELINRAVDVGGRILDCGAGSRAFVHERLIQTEIVPFPNIDVLAVNQVLPFRDNVFDVVFSFDVLEHVTDPFGSARELARVLKPGGLLQIDLPFLQVEHGYPHHFFNATRMGLLQLFEGVLDVKGHIVPNSGHPAHVLYTILNGFKGGIPKTLRPKYDSLTIGDILSKSWKDFRDSDIGQALSEKSKWKLASSTQAIFSKPDDGVEISSRIDGSVNTLPTYDWRRGLQEL